LGGANAVHPAAGSSCPSTPSPCPCCSRLQIRLAHSERGRRVPCAALQRLLPRRHCTFASLPRPLRTVHCTLPPLPPLPPLSFSPLSTHALRGRALRHALRRAMSSLFSLCGACARLRRARLPSFLPPISPSFLFLCTACARMRLLLAPPPPSLPPLSPFAFFSFPSLPPSPLSLSLLPLFSQFYRSSLAALPALCSLFAVRAHACARPSSLSPISPLCARLRRALAPPPSSFLPPLYLPFPPFPFFLSPRSPPPPSLLILTMFQVAPCGAPCFRSACARLRHALAPLPPPSLPFPPFPFSLSPPSPPPPSRSLSSLSLHAFTGRALQRALPCFLSLQCVSPLLPPPSSLLPHPSLSFPLFPFSLSPLSPPPPSLLTILQVAPCGAPVHSLPCFLSLQCVRTPAARACPPPPSLPRCDVVSRARCSRPAVVLINCCARIYRSV
jgi:hypothetical protein